MKNNDKIDSMLEEMGENRCKMQEMLGEVIEIKKDSLKKIFGDSKDFRNRHAIDYKMKIFTDFINAELSIRRQIESSIKTEIDIRNKQEVVNKEDDSIYDYNKLIELVNKRESQDKDVVNK